MKVAVWDTYVSKKDGSVMHFDILVPETQKNAGIIYGFCNEYLKLKSHEGKIHSINECNFCHIEEASPKMLESIGQKGYFVIEMEGCN